MKFCHQCGEEIVEIARYCSACGVQQAAPAPKTFPQQEFSLEDPSESSEALNLAPSVDEPSLATHEPEPGLFGRFWIQISARYLNWPRECVCCLGHPDIEIRAAASRTTGTKKPRTTQSWWDVPYCSQCLAHKKAFENAGLIIIPFLLFAILVWISVAVQFENNLLGFFIGMPIMLFSIKPYLRAQDRAKGMMKPSCSAQKDPISYLDWHGTMHTFVFTNKAYLDRFLDANSEKKRSDVRPA